MTKPKRPILQQPVYPYHFPPVMPEPRHVRRHEHSTPWDRLNAWSAFAMAVFALIGFLIGGLVNSYERGQREASLVTQGTLADVIKDMKAYIDSKQKEIIATDQSYSDANRLKTLNDVDKAVGESKQAVSALQSKVDSVAVKQDLTFDIVRQLQQQVQVLADQRRK